MEGEFSDTPADLVEHKYLIKNFRVQLRLQLNKNVKSPTEPATMAFPQVVAKVIVGSEEETDQSKLKVDVDGQIHADQNALSFFLYQP